MKTIPLRAKTSPFSRFRGRRYSWDVVFWWVAFACAVFGLLSGLHLIIIPLLAGYAYWIVLAGLILLLAATR